MAGPERVGTIAAIEYSRQISIQPPAHTQEPPRELDALAESGGAVLKLEVRAQDLGGALHTEAVRRLLPVERELKRQMAQLADNQPADRGLPRGPSEVRPAGRLSRSIC